MTQKPYIIGCDEVGYGALSGPLVIGAIRAPKDWAIPGLNDSKKLSDKQRRKMNEKIRAVIATGEISFAIAERCNKYIDERGVFRALRTSYQEVSKALYSQDSLIIIDGNVNFDKYLGGMDYQTVIKADSKYPTVMAASIIAKVYRDDIMIKLSDKFPLYDWSSNKGYGSAKHIDAIKKIGYTELHRQSYKLK